MNKQKTPEKPLILAIEEAKAETIAMVNQIIKRHALPCYVYEMIFEQVHGSLKEAAKNELTTASALYSTPCAVDTERKEEEHGTSAPSV